MIVSIVDPREPAHTSVPDKETDLMVAAATRNVIAIDNVTSISKEMSDAYCRLTTGGGMERRELYSDSNLHTLSACSSVIVTSIFPPTNREDFQRRAINFRIRPASNDERLAKEDVEAMAEWACPRIMGALMRAVSSAIRRREETRARLRGHLPALADMMLWVEAGAPDLGFRDGQFLDDYKQHKQAAVVEAADSDPLVQALVSLLGAQPDLKLEGTAKAVLERLTDIEAAHHEWMPKQPRYLRDQLEAKQALLAAARIAYSSRIDKKTKNPIFELRLEGQEPSPF